jgi:hypothetical protein
MNAAPPGEERSGHDDAAALAAQLEKRQKQPTVLLLKGEEIIMAGPGETLEDIYRVEAITDSSVDFTYLPLASRQSLAVPPPQ